MVHVLAYVAIMMGRTVFYTLESPSAAGLALKI